MTEPLDDARAVAWFCFAGDGQFIRAWTRDPVRAKAFLDEGLDMQPHYAAPVPQCKAEPVTRHITGYGPDRYAPLYATPHSCSDATIECPNCHDANKHGDYEGPTCQVCFGIGRITAPTRSDADTALPAAQTMLELAAEMERCGDDGAFLLPPYVKTAVAALRTCAALVPPPSEAGREEQLEAALRDILSWKEDTLGARPKAQYPYDCPPEITEAFDRGARIAFYRCALRASAALSPDPGTVAVASGPSAEDIRACARSTLIGFQHELGDSNIEFICDQISRKATMPAMSSAGRPTTIHGIPLGPDGDATTPSTHQPAEAK